MDMNIIITVIVLIVLSLVAFFVGRIIGSKRMSDTITRLTSERDVQRAVAENALRQADSQKTQYEERLASLKSEYIAERVKAEEHFEKDQSALRVAFESQLAEYKADADSDKKEATERFQTSISDLKESYEAQIRDVKAAADTQIAELKDSYSKQLMQIKENSEKQLQALREMNQKQIEDQLSLIREQMRTTSEDVLKARQEELGLQNREQVSKIIDPLQKSLKDMEEALNKNKEQQQDALSRLDETIKQNMQKSTSLGETADRLTRALTGEVKVQGNFGEMRLKQLLEDMGLKEGEQFDTQETLLDVNGKKLKGDDEKGLIPDFILHFPNNRHVIVDSKMSLTAYDRYMNAEDGSPEKSAYLKAHIESVRAQVKRLSRKDYSSFLPQGYNRLNFAIMYIPFEGALNLAVLNDQTLWKDAYDDNVLVLGPQTMFMNLRVLEMMWTQVRQLKNQEEMMKAANLIVERVQDFGMRFGTVEAKMQDTLRVMNDLKCTTNISGRSIITAAKHLLEAGAKEKKSKKGLSELEDTIFLDTASHALPDVDTVGDDTSDDFDRVSEVKTKD